MLKQTFSFLFFVSFLNYSLCNDIITDLDINNNQQDNALNEQIGKGFVISNTNSIIPLDDVSGAIQCLQSESFDMPFIFLYASGAYVKSSNQWFEPLKRTSMISQYVIQPSLQDGKSADNIFDEVLTGLKPYGIALNFVWIDTLFLNAENKADSLKFYTELQDAAAKKSITVGIRTTSTFWYKSLDNTTDASSKHQFLWEDNDETSFTQFVPFGGWKSQSVITGDTSTQCIKSDAISLNILSVLYRRVDLVKGSTVPPPPIYDPKMYGKGLSIYVNPDEDYWQDFGDSIECYKKNYDSTFLYIYESEEYVFQIEDLINKTLNAGLNVQFVVMPDSMNVLPQDIVKTIVERFQTIQIRPTMIWLDTFYLRTNTQDVNRKFVNELTVAFKESNINLHITTTLRQWMDSFGDWQEYSASNVLLWDEQEITSESAFIPFGGWNSVTAFTYIDSTCEKSKTGTNYRTLGITYKKDKIDFYISTEPRSTSTPKRTTGTTPTINIGSSSTQYSSTPVASTIPPIPISSGIVIEANGTKFEDIYSDVNCYGQNNYESLFLYILENNMINLQILDIINLAPDSGISVQLVIQPIFGAGSTKPDVLLSKIMTSINQFNFQPQFIWLDVEQARFVPDSTNNTALLEEWIKAFNTFNLNYGIATSKSTWTIAFGNYNKLLDVLLWELSDLKSFHQFTPFGNWSSSAVFSLKTSSIDCKYTSTNFKYRDAFYIASELNFNIPKIATDPAPSTTPPTTTVISSTQMIETTTTKGSNYISCSILFLSSFIYFLKLA